MSGFIPCARPFIGDEERAAVDRVLRSGMLAQGPEVAAVRAGVRRAVRRRPALRRGQLGHLRPAPRPAGRGVGPGDEVIVPSFTFAAHRQRGRARRRHAGVRRHRAGRLLPRPGRGRGGVTERTVGIMPVHLYGHPADMPRCRRSPTGTACRSSRTPRRRTARRCTAQPVGTFGTFGMFSLYPTKNMTVGEGGMVAVRRPPRSSGCCGSTQPGHGAPVRERGRRPEHPDDRHPRRHRPGAADASWPAGPASGRTNAAFLDANLERRHRPDRWREGAVHVYHQYTVRVPEDRDGFAAALARGARHRLRRLLPDPRSTACRRSGRDVDLPETETAARECSRCRSTRRVTAADLERIVNAVNALAAAGG